MNTPIMVEDTTIIDGNPVTVVIEVTKQKKQVALKATEDREVSDMFRILRENFDYISMYKAVKYLKPLYSYINGWTTLAVRAWKLCGYDY